MHVNITHISASSAFRMGSLMHAVLGFLAGTCVLLYKLFGDFGEELMFSSAQLTKIITWIGLWVLFIGSCWLFGGIFWSLMALLYNLMAYLSGKGLVIKMEKCAFKVSTTPELAQTLPGVGDEIAQQYSPARQKREKDTRLKRVRSRWRGSV